MNIDERLFVLCRCVDNTSAIAPFAFFDAVLENIDICMDGKTHEVFPRPRERL